MPLDTDAEVVGLRAVLRDLVALSTIPAAWVGRDPPVVAAGLADVVIALLQVDFAAVRLLDPSGASAIEVMRGDAWKTFPEWLDRQLAKSGQLSVKEIIPDVDAGAESCRGVVIPIGVNGEGGVVAAACDRPDFPTEIDQLLLSLAANHAATAVQSSRLVLERRRAEEELGKARDELEVKVTEQTAELRRSEAYLAEAQRLTNTGSVAIDVTTQEVSHSSDEHLRLFGFDPKQGIRPLSEFFERIHPQDRATCTEAIERGIRDAASLDVEYRVVLPHRPVRRHRVIAHPGFDASGQLDEFVGTVVDVTERREAETELERLAAQQAALRRVAMLVAEGPSPTAVFDAVAVEMEGLLAADGVTVSRYESDDEVTVLAHCGSIAAGAPPGTRVRAEPNTVSATVRRSGHPARMEHYEGSAGAIADLVHTLGVRAAVGAPIVVESRLWGVVIAIWRGTESPPADTEARMAQFAQLLGTAIANADTSDQLTASRARLLSAGDDARRRVVRDLHDGAQQRLVHAIVMLKLAQRAIRDNDERAESLVGTALEHAERGNAELRELAHGLLPAALTRGGLQAGVDAVVTRIDLPVEVDVPAERFPAEIEASAYFIVAEALTNVVKHAHAGHAAVRASVRDGTLHIEVRDDGAGGADPEGHGLVGMGDRVNALGGRLRIESPAGGGTLVTATLPLPPS